MDSSGSGSPASRRDYGPFQLADWLQQNGHEYVPVNRAGDLGLLPYPDCAGGRRWSAEQAEDIRSRWPEIAAASRCVGAPGLKERGWTEAMIRDLLGEPDLWVDNPHYKNAGQMRLWRLQRAEAIEATPEFAERKERSERQTAKRRVWRALGGYDRQEGYGSADGGIAYRVAGP
jgi:hypothetical protein